MLNPSDLANQIQTALGRPDLAITSQISGLASAITDHLMSASVNFIPGTITGNTSVAPGPISNGKGANGLIVLVSAALEAGLISVFGSSTPQLSGLALAISTCFSSGSSKFASGNIIGASTAVGPPTPAPGVFLGSGLMGTVGGLNDNTLASSIAGSLGGSSAEISDFSAVITSYTEANATVTLALATGTVPTAGGPIVAGTGLGGVIS